MAYKVIILYQLYMPSYFLGTFTEYPFDKPLFSRPEDHSSNPYDYPQTIHHIRYCSA